MTRLSDLRLIGRFTLGDGRVIDYIDRDGMLIERSVHEVWRAHCRCGWFSPSFRPGDYERPMDEIARRLDDHYVATAEQH